MSKNNHQIYVLSSLLSLLSLGLLGSNTTELAPALMRKIQTEWATLSTQHQHNGRVTTNCLVITADNCPVLQKIVTNLAQKLNLTTPEIVIYQSYRSLRAYDHWRIRYHAGRKHSRLIIGKELLQILTLPEFIALLTYELHDAAYQPETHDWRAAWQYILLFDGAFALSAIGVALTGPFAPATALVVLQTLSAITMISAGALVTIPPAYTDGYDLYRGQQCLANVSQCRAALLTIAHYYPTNRSVMLSWLTERLTHLNIIELAEQQLAQQMAAKSDFNPNELLAEFKAV